MSTQPDGSQPQTGGAKLGDQVRERSPFMFLVIGLCFFLPFVSISCSGQDIATLSGVQLVTGAEVEVDPAFVEQMEEAFGAEGSDVPQETEETDPSIWAIVALAAAVIGVVAGFVTKGRTRAMASLVAALVGLAGLIGLRFDLQGDVSEAEGLVSISYKIGYWIVALLFLALALAHGMFMRGARQTGPPSTGPPGPGP
jgi:hypothetical protein